MMTREEYLDCHGSDVSWNAKGYCDECGSACNAVRVDMGNDPYEHYWEMVSPCCHAEVLAEAPEDELDLECMA